MKKGKALVIVWEFFDEIRPLFVVVHSEALTDADWTKAHEMFSAGSYIAADFPVIYLESALFEAGLDSYLQGEARRLRALLLDVN